MFIRQNVLVLVLAALTGVFAGCQKSGPEKSPTSPVVTNAVESGNSESVQSSNIVTRLHWLGKKRLEAEANATNFMSIWNLPESGRLETQVLDKLATAPWRLLLGQTNEADAASGLLRPLLDDLVQDESFLEIRGSGNGTAEIGFAIRLGKERVELWKTNLAAVLMSLTGIRVSESPDVGGWTLKRHDSPQFVELSEASEWLVLGASSGKNTTSDGMKARIKQGLLPMDTGVTNFWIEADFDPKQVSDALSLGWAFVSELPRISFNVIGNGESVLTRGNLRFDHPLNIEFEPWDLPTNLISEPLTGFTAARGIRPWLASSKWWQKLEIGPPPNQFFLWEQPGIPSQVYFAATNPNPTNALHLISQRLIESNFLSGEWGSIRRATNSNGFYGLLWEGMPFLSPYLQAIVQNEKKFVYGGSVNGIPLSGDVPEGLYLAIQKKQNNLIWYDWEKTNARMETWLYILQLSRMISHNSQLTENSPAIAWFNAVKPMLSNSMTIVFQMNTEMIAFVRQSTVGLNSAEIHILSNWLESSIFPSL